MGFFTRLGAVFDLFTAAIGQRIKGFFGKSKRVKNLELENQQLKAENQELKQEIERLKEIIGVEKGAPEPWEFKQLEIYLKGADRKEGSLSTAYLLINADAETIKKLNGNIPQTLTKELVEAKKYIKTIDSGITTSQKQKYFVEVRTLKDEHKIFEFDTAKKLIEFLGLEGLIQ